MAMCMWSVYSVSMHNDYHVEGRVCACGASYAHNIFVHPVCSSLVPRMMGKQPGIDCSRMHEKSHDSWGIGFLSVLFR